MWLLRNPLEVGVEDTLLIRLDRLRHRIFRTISGSGGLFPLETHFINVRISAG